jgi:hypothetical protein
MIVGGTPDVLPANYNPDTPVPSVGVGSPGVVGAVLHLTAGALLKFEYLGTEASFNNRFHFDSDSNGLTAADEKFATLTSLVNSFFMALAAAGDVAFSFGHNTGTPTVFNVGFAFLATPNLFMMIDPLNAGAVLVFLDDSGAGPDRDFDDMIIRISLIQQVPEPETLGMVGIALLMVGGFFGYRRRVGRTA